MCIRDRSWTTRAWAGALLVLFLNTAAYSAEIFHGALKSIPKGDLEAAEAYGLTGWKKFIRIEWPTMLRLGWPAYTNEAIFLFHATTLVYFSGFPAFAQKGDALYYANYFADKTFNPFIPYPILAMYFIMFTLVIVTVFGMINAFQTVAMSGEALGKTELLAKGIYEALITTAAGLLLAIPVVICHHAMVAKVDQHIYDIDRMTMDFFDEQETAATPVAVVARVEPRGVDGDGRLAGALAVARA